MGNSVGLFYFARYIRLTLHQAIIKLFRLLQKSLMAKTLSHENQIRELVESLYHHTTCGIYSKNIKELTKQWQRAPANNNEYIIG